MNKEHKKFVRIGGYYGELVSVKQFKRACRFWGYGCYGLMFYREASGKRWAIAEQYHETILCQYDRHEMVP